MIEQERIDRIKGTVDLKTYIERSEDLNTGQLYREIKVLNPLGKQKEFNFR